VSDRLRMVVTCDVTSRAYGEAAVRHSGNGKTLPHRVEWVNPAKGADEWHSCCADHVHCHKLPAPRAVYTTRPLSTMDRVPQRVTKVPAGSIMRNASQHAALVCDRSRLSSGPPGAHKRAQTRQQTLVGRRSCRTPSGSACCVHERKTGSLACRTSTALLVASDIPLKGS
jgi:hypothetical protein